MDGIGDNNDFGDVILRTCLIDATPDCEEFSFSGSD